MKEFLLGASESKTIWFSAFLAVVGVVEANISFLQAALGEQSYGWVIFGIGIVSALLRAVTKESLTEKGENNQ